MTRTFAEVLAVYEGSNGDATKALYAELVALGPAGVIAMNLFRAQKASARAKVYRGGGYRGMAYEKKDWSLGLLNDALVANPGLGIVWGWGLDLRAVGFEHVLYLDLPTGQVSFYNGRRHAGGPDYPGDWDSARGQSPTRVCRHVANVLAESAAHV